MARGQPFGVPDNDSAGDAMIRRWLAAETARIEDAIGEDLVPHTASRRKLLHSDYLYMLGLAPEPPRTPLETTVTSRLQGDGFIVEMLHYQSMPGLYVTANLWRPVDARPGLRYPAVLTVCGHSGRGRDGNKTAFQDQGIWFARHGYVCLVVDTLQLGEIAATHHGTYREGRWWWQSRGYTPAGVECWNGIRGIDLLSSRDDVDGDRIGVTGISGGGAATFWIAAADERVKVAVPVSGMADLSAYVPGRCVNGHCDCMFMINTFHWPWTRIASLVAPRPLLLVNSDSDPIFPMDANERLAATLERVYSLHGAGDRFDAMVSRGGHAYRADIRAAVYRFLNTHLKDDPRPVTDGEIDLVDEHGPMPVHPIAPQRLRVFRTDADLPTDQRNTTIDESFVPIAAPDAPSADGFASWKAELLDGLRRVTFRRVPGDRLAPPPVERATDGPWRVESEPGMFVFLTPPKPAARASARRHRLVVRDHGAAPATTPIDGTAEWILEPRGVGPGAWTTRNPPNHVERSLALLGDSVAAGQVRDTLAALAAIRAADADRTAPPPIEVAGYRGAGIVAAYAAIFSPLVDAVHIVEPPATHMAAEAPAFLNVLRVADVPVLLGLLAPRRLAIEGVAPEGFATTAAIYAAAAASDRLTFARP